MSGQISHAECVTALDAALSGLVPRLKPEELEELRAVMLANNAILAKIKKIEKAARTKAAHG